MRRVCGSSDSGKFVARKCRAGGDDVACESACASARLAQVRQGSVPGGICFAAKSSGLEISPLPVSGRARCRRFSLGAAARHELGAVDVLVWAVLRPARFCVRVCAVLTSVKANSNCATCPPQVARVARPGEAAGASGRCCGMAGAGSHRRAVKSSPVRLLSPVVLVIPLRPSA